MDILKNKKCISENSKTGILFSPRISDKESSLETFLKLFSLARTNYSKSAVGLKPASLLHSGIDTSKRK